MRTLTEAASSDSQAAAAGTTEWPARPRCTCDCGCHRKPGRRIICPGCYRYIGPGWCWRFAHQMCHVCFQWGWPEPEPETQPLFFEHQHETENRYVGQITKPQNMYAPDGTPDRRDVADKLSDGRRNLSQVFPSGKKGRGKRTPCKGKGRQSRDEKEIFFVCKAHASISSCFPSVVSSAGIACAGVSGSVIAEEDLCQSYLDPSQSARQ